MSRVSSDLSAHSALSWLEHFWLFEFVFVITVTLVATWGRDDDVTRAHPPGQRPVPSQRDYL
jgi:hypothetical protein